MKLQSKWLASRSRRILVFSGLLLANSCGEARQDPVTPIPIEKPSTLIVIDGNEFGILDELRARTVLAIEPEQRAPLLVAADVLETTIATRQSAAIEKAFADLRTEAVILPAAERTALDLALIDLASHLGIVLTLTAN